jgi:Mg-chelatase subunit ChlD
MAAPSDSAAAGERADADDDSGGEETPDGPQTQSGTLTAGAWDDNQNFDRFSRYRSRLLQRNLLGAMSTTDEEHERANEIFSEQRQGHERLDVSLVIDTTGSMGDEIAYLQAEFLALSRTIEELYPDSDQRWSMVVYRDEGDQYVTREYDFEADAATFRERLSEQSAGGGGDLPEAPDAAMQAMTQLDWREGAEVARLVLWVADAPHHEQNADAMADAVRAAADLGIAVYPVASSGVDELAELTMRSTAQLTGGRYLFLTDDSGVGGEHKEPNIPCYFVTRLDHAILRMIDIELSGNYREPTESEVIRTGGDPENGRCVLESGDQVSSF